MDEKTRLRREILARRDLEPDRAQKSAVIGEKVMALPGYRGARLVAWFVGVKSEVETLPFIGRELGAGRRIVVPVVAGGELSLHHIYSLDELAPAPFGLLEPPTRLREDPARLADPATVDFFVVPGVAFDRHGGRLGHGRGYYDRLLARGRPEASRTATGFECQMVESVPMDATDVHVHRVVTEASVYEAGF